MKLLLRASKTHFSLESRTKILENHLPGYSEDLGKSSRFLLGGCLCCSRLRPQLKLSHKARLTTVVLPLEPPQWAWTKPSSPEHEVFACRIILSLSGITEEWKRLVYYNDV